VLAHRRRATGRPVEKRARAVACCSLASVHAAGRVCVSAASPSRPFGSSQPTVTCRTSGRSANASAKRASRRGRSPGTGASRIISTFPQRNVGSVGQRSATASPRSSTSSTNHDSVQTVSERSSMRHATTPMNDDAPAAARVDDSYQGTNEVPRSPFPARSPPPSIARFGPFGMSGCASSRIEGLR
jgi:hypothetical protein